MAYRQQIEQFRKEIRRSQLQEIFQNRRIKYFNDTADPMEPEQPPFLKKSSLDSSELLSLAKLSQTEAGIDIINHANYGEQLVKYLCSEYVDTEDQLYATYTLCNLSYKSTNMPSSTLLAGILSLLEQISNQKVADNLLWMLGNTMYDYQQAKERLVTENLLVERLIAILNRFNNPSIPLCFAISNCILQMLNRAHPEQSFIKLRQILLRFIKMEATIPESLVIIKQSTFSLYLLASMFPSNLVDFIINGGVFGRLIELYKKKAELSFISFMIKIANAILKDFKENVFAGLLLPLLDEVLSSDFQTNKASGFNGHALRIETYKLINAALELDKLKVDQFMGSNMGKRILTSFQFEDDSEIRRELVFVFTPVYLNTHDENCKIAIQTALLRTRELDTNNFELVGHIEQLKFLFRR